MSGNKSGRAKVNLGAIYSSTASTSPIVVTGQTHGDGFPVISKDISKAAHLSPRKDKTGYLVPSGLEFAWEGRRRDGEGHVSAKLSIEHAGTTAGEGGLIEKVDVLAEIPYVIRKGLAAAGTKPYIFQVSQGLVRAA